MSKSLPKDHQERQRAILERERNVIVDAGAGTGKTTLLVARLLHLIAPDDDGPCFPLERVAAITFTRKAAGELKLRMRQALLQHGARTDLTPLRRARLQAGMESLDNAAIGTVHSFADRLLRLRPADARVSPEYEIAEDTADLEWETYAWLLEAAQQGTLAAAMAGTEAESLVDEVTETLHIFQRADFRTQTKEEEDYALIGLDWVIRDLIATRDRTLELPAARSADLSTLPRIVDEFRRDVAALSGSTSGERTLRRLLKQAEQIVESDESGEVLRRVKKWAKDVKRAGLQKERDFQNDERGWDAWSWLTRGTRGARKNKQERPGGPLCDELCEPLFSWLAERIVRMRPVVLTRYTQCKRARQQLDQVDLLVELRDLLRRDKQAREFYQARFDHVMVDEFQDTDPLQAEILLFLCERAAQAEMLEEIELAAGKLTIVGDPKQSIYRFRRADIAMYADVCARVRKGPACEAQLSVNFRATPELIAWTNTAFDAMLGAAGSGPPFDPDTGAVCNLSLTAGRGTGAGASVHVLPFGDAALKVEASRDLEGEALARYLRWLVEESEVQVLDPRAGTARRPQYGDMAVLMVSTQTVHHLLDELDKVGVPHVVRGGTLFMQDALHRQFLLALRALSDRRDGVAEATLMRPPFFALGLDELVRDRMKGEGEEAPALLRETRALIAELRLQRHQRSAGETARALLEQSGFGGYVAAGENGAQRLARLYELCLALDLRARDAGLDFDGVTALAREWIDRPIHLEAPLPVDADAVQVITVHQAKGLEWPIVALWDGRASRRGFLPQPALSVDAASGQWSLFMDGLNHDPSGRALRQREIRLLDEERKRVAYVAVTRARDLLIVPEAGAPKDATIAGHLLRSTATQGALRLNDYRGDGPAWWSTETGVSIGSIAPVRADLDVVWSTAARAALEPVLVPAGVSTVTHAVHVDEADEPDPMPKKDRTGRYGPVFGSTVHRALELVLTRCAPEPAQAVQWAARELGLDVHLEQAEADVTRTLLALERTGLLREQFVLEYPIAGALEPSTLLAGYVDLLVASADTLIIVDFKTDEPPAGEASKRYPGYVAQVGAYAKLLQNAGVAGGRRLRQGLLFTADGGLRWVGE